MRWAVELRKAAAFQAVRELGEEGGGYAAMRILPSLPDDEWLQAAHDLTGHLTGDVQREVREAVKWITRNGNLTSTPAEPTTGERPQTC